MKDFDYKYQGIKFVELDRLFSVGFDDSDYFTKFQEVIGNYEIAGLYLLINSKNDQIYVGESTDILQRNKIEIKNGFGQENMKDFKWDKVILIWDGRPAVMSHFADDAFRKLLEKYCIKIFQGSKKYKCRNKIANPRLTKIRIKSKAIDYEKDVKELLESNFSFK